VITTTLELALTALCAEFALLSAGLCFMMWRGGKRQEQSTIANVSSLVSTVEQSDSPRREALLTVLRETYRFDDSKAEKVVSDFIEREHAFYNALIGVHLGRGGKTLADVPAEVTRLVAPWLRLTPTPVIDEDAVEALQTQNLTLTNQLAETKEVLDELMSEYSAAFLRGQTDPMVRLDEGDEPDPVARQDALADTTLADEAPRADSAPRIGEVPDDELLSMDDDLADVVPATLGADTADVGVDVGDTGDTGDVAGDSDDDFGFGQNVIDLDDDDDPALADEPEPLSQNDLDALMDNLGLDTPASSTKPVPA